MKTCHLCPVLLPVIKAPGTLHCTHPAPHTWIGPPSPHATSAGLHFLESGLLRPSPSGPACRDHAPEPHATYTWPHMCGSGSRAPHHLSWALHTRVRTSRLQAISVQIQVPGSDIALPCTPDLAHRAVVHGAPHRTMGSLMGWMTVYQGPNDRAPIWLSRTKPCY